MKIISGKTGSPHVTSQQFRQIFEGIIGDESCILPCGENLTPELQTNNSLKIRSGLMYHHGNVSTVELGTYDEVTIQNGTQGMKRIDLVVNRYTREEESGTEKNEWIVIQGTPHASSPVVPDYTEGNLQDGDLVDDCPYLEVHLDGINVTEVKQLLSVANAMSTINKYFAEGFRLSETEIETPEKFIDGKKIYSMTIVTNDTIPASGDLTIPLSLSVADCIWIDPQNSYIRSATQCFPLPVPRFSVSDDSYIGIWLNTAGIRLYSNAGWNDAWEKCITLRYTKKTD